MSDVTSLLLAGLVVVRQSFLPGPFSFGILRVTLPGTAESMLCVSLGHGWAGAHFWIK